jgi:23S rRNA (guanine2445-N2)-methyltransferase / 23S rRNA (guanine2069-N7)-methyltransferase
MAVVCVGRNPQIRHTHFGALKVKDAVCDVLRRDTGERPDVDRAEPDVQVHVHVHGDKAGVSIDLSGRPLHFRDRDRDGGPAPLKETLAAGILSLARWSEVVEGGGLLVDPMAGSGTLVIEAADIARRRAPGLRRRAWGFSGWRGHDASVWQQLVEEARDLQRPAGGLRVFASDRDADQVKRLEGNLRRAGMVGEVKVRTCDLSQVHPPKGGGREEVPRGLLVTNPPYGVRLGEEAEVRATWKELGNVLRRRFLGWEGWLLAGDPTLAKSLGLRPKRRHVVYNGPLEARLLEVPIRTKAVARDVEAD